MSPCCCVGTGQAASCSTHWWMLRAGGARVQVGGTWVRLAASWLGVRRGLLCAWRCQPAPRRRWSDGEGGGTRDSSTNCVRPQRTAFAGSAEGHAEQTAKPFAQLMVLSPVERVGCCLKEGRGQQRGVPWVPRGWGAAASVLVSACILLLGAWCRGAAHQQAADGRAGGSPVSAALCRSRHARRCLSQAAQRRPRREPVLPGAACQHLADRHRIVCRGKYACPCLPPPRRGMRWQHFKARRVAG